MTVPSVPAGAERPVRRAPERFVALASTAVFVTFFFNGFNFASWAARFPAVRDELGLSPEQLGLILLVGATGSLVSLPLSGRVVQRLGARRTIVAFSVVNVVGLLMAGSAVAVGSAWLLVPSLIVFGVGTGVWDAAMNIEGAAVEQRLGRAIMPRFHAGFSFGTMAGAGLGAVAAWLHAPVVVHLAVALAVSSVGVLVCSRYFLPEGTHDAEGRPRSTGDGSDRVDGPDPATAPASTGTDPAVAAAATPATGSPASAPPVTDPAAGAPVVSAWREPRTLLIGLVVLAAALTEGAANDWVALAVVDGFGTSNDVGAIGFGVFVTAMTGMRLLGTGLLDRWGRVPVLRLSAGLSLVGLLIFGLVPGFWLALLGVVLWGMGAALGFPVGMSAASDDPRRAAARVAVVATIGYSAFLAGPPLLGLLAEHVGYRQALLAITVPVLVGLLVIQAARPLPTAAGARAADGHGGAPDPTDRQPTEQDARA